MILVCTMCLCNCIHSRNQQTGLRFKSPYIAQPPEPHAQPDSFQACRRRRLRRPLLLRRTARLQAAAAAIQPVNRLSSLTPPPPPPLPLFLPRPPIPAALPSDPGVTPPSESRLTRLLLSNATVELAAPDSGQPTRQGSSSGRSFPLHRFRADSGNLFYALDPAPAPSPQLRLRASTKPAAPP